MFEKIKLKREISKLNVLIVSNDSQAMYDLAIIYLDGSIIKKDEKAAYDLLNRSAKLGNIQAKAYLLSNKLTNCVNIGAKAVDDIIATIK